ncbi:MAG: DUF4097 domain-containing protein [Peptococcaceae bacterium]|nr:DUF4097 domain-containing protein [Peptococcaceae bacterium]
MGFMLIATGILLLMSELQGFNGAGLVLRWWPVILIVLGIEILVYIVFSHEEQPKIKFDGLSIFLVILLILISSGAYAASSFMKSDFSKGFFSQIGYFKNESIINKTFDIDAAKVKKLQVNNSRGQVQIDRYSGDKIKVDAAIIIKNNDEEKAVKLAQDLVEVTEGETLTLNTRSISVLEDNRGYQFTVNYAVKVPKELTFEINNKFGEINLENLTGNIFVNGKFGKIEVANIQGDARIENAFGETKVQNVTGKVAIDNEQGEIFYASKQAARNDITLNCKMGGINVELPRDQQGTFNLYTKFGNINFKGFSSELPIQKDNTKQEMKGIIGTASPQITVNADHGEISLSGK